MKSFTGGHACRNQVCLLLQHARSLLNLTMGLLMDIVEDRVLQPLQRHLTLSALAMLKALLPALPRVFTLAKVTNVRTGICSSAMHMQASCAA